MEAAAATVAQMPRPRTARTSRNSIASRLEAETSEVEMEEVEPKDREAISKKALTAWRRTALRLIYEVILNTLKRVERHWEMKALQHNQQTNSHITKARSAMQKLRRDDLTGVGEAVAPTSKKYPVDRKVCTHQDMTGLSALKAQGGQMTCKVTRRPIPMYLWVCTSCGARWSRIRTDPNKPLHEQTQKSTALRPVAARTSEKRELESDEKPMEVLIHSDKDHPDLLVVTEAHHLAEEDQALQG